MLMKREANFEDEIWSFFKENQHTHHNSFAFVKEISGECLRKYMIVHHSQIFTKQNNRSVSS